jgi:glycerol-3-phosphate dehydrogenase
VYPIAPGVIGITGGKLTTYRAMAEEAVDLVAEGLGCKTGARTRAVQLGSSDLAALRRLVEPRVAALGLEPGTGGDLVRRYGERALDVLALAAETGLTGPLAEGQRPLAAEALYCARAEMVVHLNDLLARRTRLALIDRAAGAGSVAAELLAGELGWSEARRDTEVEAHLEAVMSERGLGASGSDEPDSSRAETG